MWFSARAGVFSTQHCETTELQQGGRLSEREVGGCEVCGSAWLGDGRAAGDSTPSAISRVKIQSHEDNFHGFSPSFCSPARRPWRQGLARLVARAGSKVGQGLARVGNLEGTNPKTHRGVARSQATSRQAIQRFRSFGPWQRWFFPRIAFAVLGGVKLSWLGAQAGRNSARKAMGED